MIKEENMACNNSTFFYAKIVHGELKKSWKAYADKLISQLWPAQKMFVMRLISPNQCVGNRSIKVNNIESAFWAGGEGGENLQKIRQGRLEE